MPNLISLNYLCLTKHIITRTIVKVKLCDSIAYKQIGFSRWRYRFRLYRGYENGNGINDDGHAILITGHDDKTGDYEYWNPEDAAYHTTDGSNFIGGWQLDHAK